MERVRIYEILIVCVVSGCGMILSGQILDQWRTHNTITETDPLWTMITPLLGLKGNLEMTLASRLSTKAKLVGLGSIVELTTTNLIIIQIQGIMVGCGVSVLVGIMNNILNVESGIISLYEFIRLAFIGILTASTACLILGSITIVIVYLSSKYKFDPDNIASPLAATLGDTVTLIILYYFIQLCPSSETMNFWHYSALISVFFILLPLMVKKVDCEENRSIFRTCWFSIVSAMILSILSGFILKSFVFRVKYLAIFQPLINGVGKNVASILCSSMSTDSHKLKKDDSFIESDFYSNCAQLQKLLLFVAIFTHALLLTIANITGIIDLSDFVPYILPFFCSILLQTVILLFFVKYLIIYLRTFQIDPDNSSIPLATGFGDLLGTSLLCTCLRN